MTLENSACRRHHPGTAGPPGQVSRTRAWRWRGRHRTPRAMPRARSPRFSLPARATRETAWSVPGRSRPATQTPRSGPKGPPAAVPRARSWRDAGTRPRGRGSGVRRLSPTCARQRLSPRACVRPRRCRHPGSIGLTLVMRRSARETIPAMQLPQGESFEAAVIPSCSGSHAC